MASVTGSRLAFFGEGINANKINVVLTADGKDTAALAAAVVAGDLNIEVFTTTPAGGLAAGYQASAFIQGAQLLGTAPTNALQAGSPSSIEEILTSIPDSGTKGSGFTGNLVLDDFSGGATRGESITIGGSAGQTYSVFGSQGDTITGSSNANVSNYIDASGTLEPKNPPGKGGPFPGAETVQGGAGPTTVRGGTGDVITGGAGSLVVTDEHHDGNQTVTGGSGSLKIFEIGQNFSIVGSTAGTTIINDDYGNGGGSSIVGGNGAGLISDTDFKGLSGENTFIVAASTDRVTIGNALTYLNAFKGNVTITGGDDSTNTGTVEGAVGFNSNILAGKGDVITLRSAQTYIDATAGSVTITGGSGFAHIEAGKSDVITGGSGRLDINNIGNGDSITGGTGNLFSFGKGTGATITGSTDGWTLINSGGKSSITGGTGITNVPSSLSGGLSDSTIINAGGGDTITGGANASSSSTTYVNALADGSADTVTAGAGPTTVLAGMSDSVIGGSGTVEVDFDSDQTGKATTIDLGKGSGVATLRDVFAPTSPGAPVTSGPGTSVTVTGFTTGLGASSDVIASKTTTGAELMASAKSDGKGGTIITFNDKSTLDLAGVADITKVKFTS